MGNIFNDAGDRWNVEERRFKGESGREMDDLGLYGGLRQGDTGKQALYDVLDPGGFVIGNSGKSKSEQEEEARLREREAQLNALGQSELGMYKTTIGQSDALTTGQAAESQKIHDIEQARARAFAANLGISGSTMEDSMLARADQNKVILEENMRQANHRQIFSEAEAHWKNAVQALGMSNQQLQFLYQQHEQEKEKSDQAFTNLLTTVATLVASYYTGGAAGAVVGAATENTDTQRGPVYGGSYASTQSQPLITGIDDYR